MNTRETLKRELEATRERFWNVDPNAGALLQALIHSLRPQEILEIGASNGYSAILMAEAASIYGGHITTIEFFPERIALAQLNIARAELAHTVTILEGDALEILPQLAQEGKQFGFIFLDANKEEYVQYFSNAMKMITPYGLIVADNTISHQDKLGSFFDAVRHEPRASTLSLPIGTGMMVIQVS